MEKKKVKFIRHVTRHSDFIKLYWRVISWVRNKTVKPRKNYLNDIKSMIVSGGYEALKRAVEDRRQWLHRQGVGFRTHIYVCTYICVCKSSFSSLQGISLKTAPAFGAKTWKLMNIFPVDKLPRPCHTTFLSPRFYTEGGRWTTEISKSHWQPFAQKYQALPLTYPWPLEKRLFSKFLLIFTINRFLLLLLSMIAGNLCHLVNFPLTVT